MQACLSASYFYSEKATPAGSKIYYCTVELKDFNNFTTVKRYSGATKKAAAAKAQAQATRFFNRKMNEL